MRQKQFESVTRFDTNPQNAKEALELSGLNFNVTKMPIKTISTGIEIPNKYVNWRADKLNSSDGYLGVVGSGYQIIQNRDALSFFDNIMAKEEMIYTGAGLVKNGKRVWLQAQIPGQIILNDEDKINRYVLLVNSHDGSSSMYCKLTTVRLVCNNSLNLALKGKGSELRIQHSSQAKHRLENAYKVLKLAKTEFKMWEERIQKMTTIKVGRKDLDTYFDAVLDVKKGKKISTKTTNVKTVLQHLFKNGVGAELNGGTVWSALNAVTEYVDHHKNFKGGQRNEAIWFGTGDRMKIRAERVAEEMFLQ